jgi:hypothetical protein
MGAKYSCFLAFLIQISFAHGLFAAALERLVDMIFGNV